MDLQDLFFSHAAHYAEIAKELLCRQQSVIDFFDAVVDIIKQVGSSRVHCPHTFRMVIALCNVRAFFDTMLPELKLARDDAMSADDGQNKLLSAVHSRDSFLRCPSSTSTGRLVLAPSMNPNWNLLL